MEIATPMLRDLNHEIVYTCYSEILFVVMGVCDNKVD